MILNEKILLKREVNLIKNSTICDIDNSMQRVLKKHSNGLTYKDLKVIAKSFIDVYDKIATPEVRKVLIDNAALEWEQGEHIGKKEEPCELCENKRSEEKFIINNKINGRKMLVGSTCIDKFDNIGTLFKGEKLSRVVKLNREVHNRLIKFNKRYVRGKLEIDDMKKTYNSYEISFPIDFDNEFRRIVKGSTKYYNDFKNGKVAENTLEEFQIYKNDFNYLECKCKKFIKENKNNKFICTKKIEVELKKKDLTETLNDIKSNGSILKEWHIKYVGNTDFVKQFSKEISNFMNTNDIKLLEIKDEKIIGKLIGSNFNNLKVELSTNKFMSKFYDVISKKKNYESMGLIFCSNVLKERNNIFNYINIVSTTFSKYKYYVEMDYEMYDAGYLEIYKNKKFAKIEIKKIIDDKNLFIDEINFEDIKEYMDKLKWRDKKDKEKFDIGNVGKVKAGGSYI